MSVFRRIIYHSGWFILFGPLIGAAIAIGIINFLPAIIGGPDSTRLIFVLFLQNNTSISDYYRLDIQSPPRMVNRCRLRADTPEIISKNN
ncbi:inner membrane protein [Salmonella enterica subsp. enterica serovar Bovismorbificans]|nr:inner membrane protein [Salmonella enterica subsp. enterica serovar Bovismorbificans]